MRTWFCTLNYFFQLKHLSSKYLLPFIKLSTHMQTIELVPLQVASKYVSTAVDFEIVFEDISLNVGLSLVPWHHLL